MILQNINPFRILGVISNASLKELKSAEVTIKLTFSSRQKFPIFEGIAKIDIMGLFDF